MAFFIDFNIIYDINIYTIYIYIKTSCVIYDTRLINSYSPDRTHYAASVAAVAAT